MAVQQDLDLGALGLHQRQHITRAEHGAGAGQTVLVRAVQVLLDGLTQLLCGRTLTCRVALGIHDLAQPQQVIEPVLVVHHRRQLRTHLGADLRALRQAEAAVGVHGDQVLRQGDAPLHVPRHEHTGVLRDLHRGLGIRKEQRDHVLCRLCVRLQQRRGAGLPRLQPAVPLARLVQVRRPGDLLVAQALQVLPHLGAQIPCTRFLCQRDHRRVAGEHGNPALRQLQLVTEVGRDGSERVELDVHQIERCDLVLQLRLGVARGVRVQGHLRDVPGAQVGGLVSDVLPVRPASLEPVESQRTLVCREQHLRDVVFR